MTGRLVLCGTPIGNLGDASPRLGEALASADLVYAEDTRRARRLLDHLGVTTPVSSYFIGNERARSGQLEQRLAAGETIALITDAGMPAVADPGYSAVVAAKAAGAAIVVVPGPSAVTAAVAVSGLVGERFCFEGFLPHKAGERRSAVEALRSESRPMVFFSAPRRFLNDLGAMQDVFGDDRAITVTRELTKLHEEVWFGTIGEAMEEWTARDPRGEFTLVVAGCPPTEGSIDAAVAEVIGRVEAGEPLSETVRAVAEVSGLRRRELYESVLRARDGLAGAGG
jgi:16S rRNA (cytidine1402-2'-O)-methyltransferase